MKKMIGKLQSWFIQDSKTEQTIRDLELRIMGLEQDNHHLKNMLSTDSITLTAGKGEEHFDIIVSKSVMKWLGNWADDKFVSNDNIDDAVSDSISNSSCVEDAVESKLDNEDWDYRLRDCLDWDRVAEKVAEKLDWYEIISDNELITRDELDPDDVMLKSEQMVDDEVVTRDGLSTAVLDELKRDWFPMMVIEQVGEAFDKKLMNARTNEQENARNAIDDEIENAVEALVREQMANKFGPAFDNWFHENIRHCIKVVLGEFLEAAYQQTKNEGEVSNG